MLVTELWETAFSTVDWRLIGLSFCFNVGLLFFRVSKWALVLKPVNRAVSFYNMSLAAFSGCLFNMIIPARLGGLVQAWIIGSKEKMEISLALGTIILVRIMDTIMLVFLGVLIAIFINIPPSGEDYFRSVFKSAALAGVAMLFIIVALFAIIKNKCVMDTVLRALLRVTPARFKPHLRQGVIGFGEGLECLNSHWHFLLGILLSLAFWLLCGINVYILLNAVGLEFRGIAPPYLILLAQVFSMGIPAPANAGPFHAATVTVLSIFGVPVQTALFSAVVMHGVMFVSNTLPGILYIFMDKTKFSTIIEGVKDAQRRFK